MALGHGMSGQQRRRSALPDPSAHRASDSAEPQVQRPHTTEWMPRRPSPLVALALVVSYVALEWLGFMHEHDGVPVTPWSPGHGLMLAAIIVGGPAYGVVFLVGVLLAEVIVLRTTLPLPLVLLIAVIIASTYTAAATMARPHLRHWHDEFRTRDILVLVATALAGSVIVSVLLCVALLSVNRFDLGDIGPTAVPLVLGDLIGIVVVTPLLLRAYVMRQRLLSPSPRILLELTLLTLALLPMLVLATWPGLERPSLFYLLFLPIVVAAVRAGIDGACVALGLAQLILVALLHLHDVDLNRFTEYQILMLVLTLTGLVVGALVSERNRADAAARVASQRSQVMQAEAARAARLHLVSGMTAALAHEINQPMTAARALARTVQERLRAPEPDRERVQANVASMIEQIDHAGAVVSNMREFLRRGEPHVSTLEVPATLRDALALARPMAAMRQVRLELELQEPLPRVWADRVQIQQVVINLISNSIEAIAETGRADGAVLVSAARTGNDVELTVRDNGGGVAPEQAQVLFDPLSTTRPDGIGLGLSICKTIVENHGGRIWLAASGPAGTELRFTLPAAPGDDRNQTT
jgi:two-component system sensor kinase FixL